MKPKTFFTSIVIITIIFIFTILYRERYSIDEVIVFEHKYEIEVSNTQLYTQFYYLTGKEKVIDIYRIDFDNLHTDLYVDSNRINHMNNVYRVYNNFTTRRIWIDQDLDEVDLEKLEEGQIELDYANVYYTDGTSEYVDFGKIYITKSGANKNILSTHNSLFDGDKCEFYFDISGKKRMQELSSRFLYDFSIEFELSINDNVINTNGLKENESTIILNKDILKHLLIRTDRNENVNPYVFQNYIIDFKLDDGETARAHIEYIPYFTNKELREYVKERKNNDE